MWLCTGDCHQDYAKLFTLAERVDLTYDDYIIILGDMGLFWRKDRSDSNLLIEKLEEMVKCNIWFIDGNHENFDLLNQLPIDEQGFRIVSPHIRWIPRGTVFMANGKRCLAIGGADSVDKFRRTPHLSWWKEEQITQEEVSKIITENKDKHFDYVFSHAAPRKIVHEYRAYLCTLHLDDDSLDHTSEEMLQQIADNISCDHHWFGHYHVDLALDNKYSCLYHGFKEII